MRVVTYNVLLGARGREDHVSRVLQHLRPDVVALQELADAALAERLGEELGMEVLLGPPSDQSGMHIALLTNRPVKAWHNHRHPGTMLRSHLEVDIDARNIGLPVASVHCLHLAARFGERGNGEVRRMRELDAVLTRIRAGEHRPHLLAGDFNALAPGDAVAATAFFRRMAELRAAGVVVPKPNGLMGPLANEAEDDIRVWDAAGIPATLAVGIPVLPRVVGSLTGRIPKSTVIDRMLTSRLRRHTVEHLLELGYTDCYRAVHPRAHGFTCATWMPAARIDYVFATREFARRLSACDVLGSRAHPDRDVLVASDHFPVVADFRAATARG